MDSGCDAKGQSVGFDWGAPGEVCLYMNSKWSKGGRQAQRTGGGETEMLARRVEERDFARQRGAANENARPQSPRGRRLGGKNREGLEQPDAIEMTRLVDGAEAVVGGWTLEGWG